MNSDHFLPDLVLSGHHLAPGEMFHEEGHTQSASHTLTKINGILSIHHYAPEQQLDVAQGQSGATKIH